MVRSTNKAKVLKKALRVIGYVRVSTEQQAESGLSIEAQREKIEQYVALHELELVDVIVDAGVSAKTLDRPGLSRALAQLASGAADGLLVVKLDRLSRSVKDWGVLIDGYFGDKAEHPVDLFSVGDSIDTRTAAGRLVLNVLMSVSQWEREATAERTITALAVKRGRGERTGGVPIGRVVGGDGKHLDNNPDEVRALQRMAELRARGYSVRAIAAALDAEGFRARGKKWHKTTIALLLQRYMTDAAEAAA